MRILLFLVLSLLVGCKAQNGPENTTPMISETIQFPSGTELSGDTKLTIGSRTVNILGGGAIIRDLAIDRFGRVTIAGRYSNGTDDDMLVARFNPDGSLDTHFGSAGIVSVEFGSGSEMAHSLSLQSDGKIVLAGRSDPEGSAYFDFAIARLEEDGSLDLSFNGTGKLLANFGESTDIGRAVKVQENGRIVTAGYTRTPHHNFPYRFGSLRLFSDGNFDPSYGSEGKVVTATVEADNGATALALQPDGKIILAGTSFDGSHNRVTVLRYREDGQLDANFASGGKMIRALGDGDDVVNAVQVDGAGRIVLAGSLKNSGALRQGFILRLLENGNLDSNFSDTAGYHLLSSEGETEYRAIQIANDNSIVGVGVACLSNCASGQNQFLIGRVGFDGRLDGRFGIAGVETLSLMGNVDFADAVACTREGICIAGGRSKNSNGVMELALHQFRVE